MRTVLLSTIAFVAGLALSAAAQNTTKQQASGCGQGAMSAKTSQGIHQAGFANAKDVPKAVVIHATDPDGNPVIMMIAPAQ